MADEKISQLTAAQALDVGDLLAVVQDVAGTLETRKVTMDEVVDFVDSAGGIGSPVTALSIASGVVNINCALGDYFTLLLTANVSSITFSNLPPSGRAKSIAIRIRQDATGGRSMALPSSLKATGGSDLAIQTAANAYTLLTMTTFDQGARFEYAMQEIAA